MVGATEVTESVIRAQIQTSRQNKRHRIESLDALKIRHQRCSTDLLFLKSVFDRLPPVIERLFDIGRSLVAAPSSNYSGFFRLRCRLCWRLNFRLRSCSAVFPVEGDSDGAAKCGANRGVEFMTRSWRSIIQRKGELRRRRFYFNINRCVFINFSKQTQQVLQ